MEIQKITFYWVNAYITSTWNVSISSAIVQEM